MQKCRHPTAGRAAVHWFAAILVTGGCGPVLRAQDDPNDLRAAAKPATAPATVTAPDSAAMKPTSDALGTQKLKIPAGARKGTIVLSDGTQFDGQIWPNLDTPYRIWVEEAKAYKDIDLASIKTVEVHVLAETMEDDWRWLKEGSDQKVYSGKKYPNVSLAYKFTLNNGQVIEGTVVGLVYVANASKTRTLTLYKQYKGNLDDTLKDLVYIKTITLDPAPAGAAEEKKTTHLPLLDQP
jgi:hypothetical protein